MQYHMHMCSGTYMLSVAKLHMHTLFHWRTLGLAEESSTTTSATHDPGKLGSWQMQKARRAGLAERLPLASYASRAAFGGSCIESTAPEVAVRWRGWREHQEVSCKCKFHEHSIYCSMHGAPGG